MHKIAITGMGMICPLSQPEDMSVNQVFERLLAGQSGISAIEACEVTGAAGYCKIAGEIKQLPEGFLTPAEQRRNGRFIHHGVIAAKRALDDAGLMSLDEEAKKKVAVIVGSGIGGIDEMHKASTALDAENRLSPFFVPSCLINMAANMISMRYGLKGASKAVVTACASSAHSIMEAAMLLQTGQANYVLAGGAEASISPLGLEGFAAMKALAMGFNDTPEAGSRPYDQKRAGFVMGEGAGILVLERLDHAKKRGAKIYATLEGFGASADAEHITNPNSEGAALCVKQALEMAGLEQVGHINAHATSTPVGDRAELKAFKAVFGEKLLSTPIAANKSATGHLLGAAGAVESIFAICSLAKGLVPPTLNLQDLDEEAFMGDRQLLIKNEVQKLEGPHSDTVLSTSFGFGGTNASLIFKKYVA